MPLSEQQSEPSPTTLVWLSGIQAAGAGAGPGPGPGAGEYEAPGVEGLWVEYQPPDGVGAGAGAGAGAEGVGAGEQFAPNEGHVTFP